MKPALLLIDLQNDFLRAPGLEPAPGGVVGRAAALLAGCRRLALPVVHVWTTVRRDDDRRMPHWKRTGRWNCVEGTEGHAPPPPLAPRPGEPVIHKVFFSAFSSDDLDPLLRSLSVDTLVMAGVHLHACLRASALDAYQRGMEVWIAEDAVASDDPVHGAITRRYLESRAARFLPVRAILPALDPGGHAPAGVSGDSASLPAMVVTGAAVRRDGLPFFVHWSPRCSADRLWSVPVCGPDEVAQACKAARASGPGFSALSMAARAQILERLADRVEAAAGALARQMAIEIGKPVTQGQCEVMRSTALLRAAAGRAAAALETRCSEGARRRYRPVGVIGLITPWNNPLAIPLGKLAPALLYGNTVVWKPAPAGTSLALRLMELLRTAGCPPGAVQLVCGDASTARALMNGDLDAVTLSGSLAAGRAAQDLCGRRLLPLQAELGGNNAAVIMPDCDVEGAACRVAEAAFGFAGQRCTANRRAIVDARCYDRFLAAVEAATAALSWGDPLVALTQAGPLVSEPARDACAGVVERAGAAASVVLQPHLRNLDADGLVRGAYYPPTIVGCDDPRQEVVQEETFGPVLVVQRADDWPHAIALCNGVRQGLVAALFSHSPELQERFLAEAQAGILKLNQATADAGVEAPFGGWKASGIGPPEHGSSNREFYTRTQAIYS